MPKPTGLRAGGWQTTVGTDLAGSTLGVLGLGRLGQRVARIGQAFEHGGRRLDPEPRPGGRPSAGVEPMAREELFASSDVVTLHLKLSDAHPRHGRAAELAP